MICALSLSKAGMPVRIIERRSKRGGISRATGVSLGTINALKDLGFPEEIAKRMTPMGRFVFYDNSKLIADILIPPLDGKPPAYLYPQSKLEEIIEQELNKKGTFVEYSTSIEGIENNRGSFAKANIKLSNGCYENESFQWIVGADGAHSSVRDICQFEFKGKIYPENWSVAEIKIDNWDDEIQAKLYLGSDGVGLILSNPEPGVVQAILNGSNVGAVLREEHPGFEFVYERGFNPSLKRVTSPRKNRVWLIGDAAHVQSPVGGQGLNLAVTDAIILSRWLNRDENYAEQQLSTQARRTLLFTDFNYKMLATKSWTARFIRNSYWRVAGKYPVISRRFFKSMSGVNHYKCLGKLGRSV